MKYKNKSQMSTQTAFLQKQSFPHFLFMSIEYISMTILVKNNNSTIGLVAYASYLMYTPGRGMGERTGWRKLYVQDRGLCNQLVLFWGWFLSVSCDTKQHICVLHFQLCMKVHLFHRLSAHQIGIWSASVTNPVIPMRFLFIQESWISFNLQGNNLPDSFKWICSLSPGFYVSQGKRWSSLSCWVTKEVPGLHPTQAVQEGGQKEMAVEEKGECTEAFET